MSVTSTFIAREESARMKRRLRRLAGFVARVLIIVVVAAIAGAVAVVLTGPGGAISCAPPTLPARPEPIPRWVIVAGAPALIPALVGAYIALGAETVRWRLIGLIFAVVVAAGTFYGVYSLLPADCRP
jgi:hypothetical protein